MTITDDIQRAIIMLREFKTATEVGEICDVKPRTVDRWKNKKIKTIRAYNWRKLYPLLKPYLTDDYFELRDCKIKKLINVLSQYLNDLANLMPDEPMQA